MVWKRRRPSKARSSGSSRRRFMFRLGGGVAVLAAVGAGVQGSRSFSSGTAPRETAVDAAADEDALIGFVGHGPVQKQQRELMAEFTDNGPEEVTITVDLQTDSDGTLYDNEGGSGSSVTFTVPSGSSHLVDIEATVEGTIAYGVTAEFSDARVVMARSVESVSGNADGAVRINKVQNFQANSGGQNQWTVRQVQVQDRDGDNDLDRVEYEVVDSSGTTRGTRTDPASGQKYQEQNISITPDEPSYDVVAGETYTLTVTAYDVDGNFDTETRQATG